MNYFPGVGVVGVVELPEEDDPGVVELLPEVEPEVEFTLLLLSFLSFLSFFAFLSVLLVELALWSLLLELELGELTPGLLALPGVDGEVWAIANGLRLIERAGTSKKASLFFIVIGSFRAALFVRQLEEQIPRHCAQALGGNCGNGIGMPPGNRYKSTKKERRVSTPLFLFYSEWLLSRGFMIGARR
jgi:hypothetical protein